MLSMLLVGSFAGPSVAAQQGPEGLWTGHWDRDGSSLAVEMTFSRTTSGYEGSFSSTQLQRTGVPLAHVKYEAPAVVWEIVGDQTTTSFEGILQGDTLSGRFHEGTASGIFSLTRGLSAEPPVREDDVTFASGSVILSGTIVSPGGAGVFPGIVFLQGSGPEGRWASRYLAHEFARRGVAALIYDKRGVGQSTGDWHSAGFSELVGDASAAVETLRSQPHVSPGSVGIYGHSQGGTIAPWVASANPHIAFVVAAAPSGVSMAETEIFSVENDLNVRALPPAQKRLAKRYVRALVATAYDGAPRAALDRAWKDVRGEAWAFKPPPASDFWWSFSRRIADYDPLHFWRRVTVPALVLYGEEDEREPPRRSAARIASAYLGAHGPRMDVIFFPLADHNYRLPNAAGTFAWPKTAPGYPERVIEWVVQVVKP
jgi:dienelactone hydrolase